jgi:hypothetical protein
MWNWFNCYLSGRHDYGMWCEPGTIFLRCIHCGKRSGGWLLDATSHQTSRSAPQSAAPLTTTRARNVVPFDRPAAVR